jgi:3-oxoacyl-[acyl-carrier-protein] synthase II
MQDRIVITGAGVISSIGGGVAEFEKALYGGACGVAPGGLLPNGAVTAEVRDFSPQQWLGNKGLRVLDRAARLLCVATQMALSGVGRASAGEIAETDGEAGLVCGTMLGSVHSITAFDWSGLEDGPNLVNPMDFPNTVINSAPGQAAIKFKLGGVNSTLCAGSASGLYALHYAAEFLRLGRARMLLAGGTEELSQEAFLGFQANRLLSPSGAVRPFYDHRDGTVLGEGAALLAMETGSAARQRDAQPWAEIAGFGCAQDAHSTHAFDARAEGATAAIQMALEVAGVRSEEVACVISSASGAIAGDAMEAAALRNVFGSRLAEIPVCAPKAALGDTLGAAGAMAALGGALALRNQCVPPTVGDSGLVPRDIRLSSHSQGIAGDYALINAFGCDGNNAAMVLRRVAGAAT